MNFQNAYVEAQDKTSGINLNTLQSHDTWRNMFRSIGRLGNLALRERHIEEIGFPILTSEVVSLLAHALLGKRVVDVGCGNGFLAKQLRDTGCTVLAVDSFDTKYTTARFENTQHGEILRTDACLIDYTPFDVVIMSWPDYKSVFAELVASKMKVGQYLIYQGEGCYGCTGTDIFHQMLDENFKQYRGLENRLNEKHVQFESIHDRWYIYKKIR